MDTLSDAYGANSKFQKTIAATTSETTQHVIQTVLSQFKLDDDIQFYSLYMVYENKGSLSPSSFLFSFCKSGTFFLV